MIAKKDIATVLDTCWRSVVASNFQCIGHQRILTYITYKLPESV